MPDIAQRREILDCKANAVEQGDLASVAAALCRTAHHLPKFGDRVVCIKLLNFALDPGLGRVFHEDVRAMQDRRGQFGLAGAVTANGVDMHATAYHVVIQDGGILFVSGAGGDDLRPLHGIFRRCASDDVQSVTFQISCTFLGSLRVDVIESDVVYTQHSLHCQALKLRLRPVADHCHRRRPLGCQMLGCQGRHRGGA